MRQPCFSGSTEVRNNGAPYSMHESDLRSVHLTAGFPIAREMVQLEKVVYFGSCAVHGCYFARNSVTSTADLW